MDTAIREEKEPHMIKVKTQIVPWKVLFLSIVSRSLILFIQGIANYLVDDHNADAYRNPYYLELSRNVNLTHLQTDGSQLAQWEKLSYNFMEGLTKWDGQYMLQISMHGYREEQHLAFFPLYPSIIAFVRYHVSGGVPQESDSSQNELNNLRQYIHSVIIGVMLNNFVFFPIAAWSLFKLTLLITRENCNYAYNTVFWFCINPASIFFSACYTESLFSSLTFTAMYLIEKKSRSQNLYNPLTMSYGLDHRSVENRRNKRDSNDASLSSSLASMKLLKIFWPAIVLISLSGSTRSNGLVNMVFVVYQFIVKLLPYYFCRKDTWTYIAYIMVTLELLRAVLVFILYSMIGTFGFLSYQYSTYRQFCTQNILPDFSRLKDLNGVADLSGIKPIKIPEWCSRNIPIAYSYVQAKYWDVGLFRYFKVKQVPNFILAAPIVFFVFYGSKKFIQRVKSSRAPFAPALDSGGKHEKKDINIGQSINNSMFIYYVEAIILTLMCSLVVNVQITTRLLCSSCPVIYWICADVQHESLWKGFTVRTIFLVYFFLGTVLHCNFYPWT